MGVNSEHLGLGQAGWSVRVAAWDG
jgi:hypothetical protein